MAGMKSVTLVAPDGSGEVNVTHPVSITNLVFGAGYKVKGKRTVDEASAYLADANAPADEDEAKVEGPKVDTAKK